jgi:glycosyltransferase involved in cell wall biosynthesis
MKLVSVIVPVFESEAFMLETLHSVLEQTYTALVVVDDDSPDRSGAVVRQVGDPRIRLSSPRRHGGACRARYRGGHPQRDVSEPRELR